ncbi:hypothetical protein RKJ46_29830, partial [Klebsiella pneumoniae]|nr:hypothetical protein [Klebsiella pneumoniae]
MEIFTDDKKSLASSVSRDSRKPRPQKIDRFFGLGGQFKDIWPRYQFEPDQLKKVCQKPRGKAWRFNQKPDEHNMTT